MRVLGLFLLLMTSVCVSHAQNDEQRVRQYLKEHLPQIASPEKVWLFQCKYKGSKNWQYMVACINTVRTKPLTTLLFAEKHDDSLLRFEPFYFTSVENFDHINMDRSRDNIEELFITTLKDSGNLAERYTGIYSCKSGQVDTLIKFYSFQYKNLRPPYFTYRPGIVVEQEDICKLTDINGDGKTDIANRIHRKIYNKEPGTEKDTFDNETDYAEYKMTKGRFVKIKTATAAAE